MRPLQCLMRRRLTDTGFTGPIAFKAGRPTPIQLVNLPVGFQRNVVMLAYGLRIRRLFVETEPQFADYEEERHLRSVDWRPLPAGESLMFISEFETHWDSAFEANSSEWFMREPVDYPPKASISLT